MQIEDLIVELKIGQNWAVASALADELPCFTCVGLSNGTFVAVAYREQLGPLYCILGEAP